jgi:hypothetical protein
MKALILISLLAFFYLGHAIVDRTYFSYLGNILYYTGLRITAPTDEVKRAY